MNWKLLLSLLLAVVAFGGLAWLVSNKPAKLEAPSQITQTAEGTNIPSTATSIDGFAYTDESGVYLRSSFGTSTVKIPDADPETFRAVGKLMEYGNAEIQEFCKGPGNYGLYADKRKTYLFQFWKTPTFSKTRIEVIKELNPDTLSVTAPQTFSDGVNTRTLGYEFGTTTCSFILIEPQT